MLFVTSTVFKMNDIKKKEKIALPLTLCSISSIKNILYIFYSNLYLMRSLSSKNKTIAPTYDLA